MNQVKFELATLVIYIECYWQYVTQLYMRIIGSLTTKPVPPLSVSGEEECETPNGINSKTCQKADETFCRVNRHLGQ